MEFPLTKKFCWSFMCTIIKCIASVGSHFYWTRKWTNLTTKFNVHRFQTNDDQNTATGFHITCSITPFLYIWNGIIHQKVPNQKRLKPYWQLLYLKQIWLNGFLSPTYESIDYSDHGFRSSKLLLGTWEELRWQIHDITGYDFS